MLKGKSKQNKAKQSTINKKKLKINFSRRIHFEQQQHVTAIFPWRKTYVNP